MAAGVRAFRRRVLGRSQEVSPTYHDPRRLVGPRRMMVKRNPEAFRRALAMREA